MESQNFFNSLAGHQMINNELRTLFCKMVEKEVYTKHKTLLNEGQTCHQMWFIVQGFAMGYRSKEGRKIPYWFWKEKEVLIPINSFFKQVPSQGFIEVLEKSTLLTISHKNVQQLSETYPEFNQMLRSIVEDCQYAAEKRIINLIALSAEERYALLMKESPSVIQKASVETIAAYLGISRKTLNRIRSKR